MNLTARPVCPHFGLMFRRRPRTPVCFSADWAKVAIERLEKICKIDLRLTDKTTAIHTRNVKRYLDFCDKNVLAPNEDSIRDYLSTLTTGYANSVKSLRVFFRAALKSDAAQCFKVPQPRLSPRQPVSREQLRKFYDALPSQKYRALFLLYATSGRRRSEILALTKHDLDLSTRTLAPLDRESQTKRTWYSFFNTEAAAELEKHLASGDFNGGAVFRDGSHVNSVFKETGGRSGVRITPQVLRQWFCNEMGRRGVQDRFIDAFCGRVPQSVLARHYTDYSPERLREIYEKANLRCFD